MGNFKILIGKGSIVNTFPTGAIAFDEVTLKTTTRPSDLTKNEESIYIIINNNAPLDT